MSVRRSSAGGPAPHVEQLQKELHDLKSAAVAANAFDGLAASGAEAAPNAPSFDQLSGTEKSAASLGVHPEAWKPIVSCASHRTMPTCFASNFIFVST